MDEKQDWPLLCVPRVVGKTHEVTRAVIKIRYEEKMPEVTVETVEAPGTGVHTDPATFLKSLPSGLSEVKSQYPCYTLAPVPLLQSPRPRRFCRFPHEAFFFRGLPPGNPEGPMQFASGRAWPGGCG